jgi:hypothetical protein
LIRLAWRQFRTEAAVAAVGLVGVATVLAVTGPHLVRVFAADPREVVGTYHALQIAMAALLLVVPALLGLFFGAPLVARELETGSFRLAWTQSVSRSRWLIVKFALVGAAASAAAGVLSLMVSWWANPLNIVDADRFSPSNFGMFGIVPFGYALFAFALGATTGLLFRRTLPAMATTLVGYPAARLAVTYWVRPHFQTPLRLLVPLRKAGGLGIVRSPSGRLSAVATPPSLPNAWGLSATVVDKAGHHPTSQYLARTCPMLLGPGPSKSGGPHTTIGKGGMSTCIAQVATRFHELVIYQPASRYWPFQIDETALFTVVAVALCAASVWWVRHRLV